MELNEALMVAGEAEQGVRREVDSFNEYGVGLDVETRVDKSEWPDLRVAWVLRYRGVMVAGGHIELNHGWSHYADPDDWDVFINTVSDVWYALDALERAHVIASEG